MKARKQQKRRNQKFKKNGQRSIKLPLTPEQKIKRKEQRQQAKKYRETKRASRKKRAENAEAKLVEKLLSSIFSSKFLDKIAKAVGFIQRKSSLLKPYAYIYLLSFGFLGCGNISLNNLTSTLLDSFGIDITPQALSKKINTKSSVRFLSTIFRKLLNIQMEMKFNCKEKEVFSAFTEVNLQDSTQVSLHPSLAGSFSGSGGAASKSAIKLDWIFDIANSVIKHVKLVSGTVSDFTLSKEIVKCIKVGGLAIRDLGYFEISTLRKIQEKFAYYISRLSINTNIYLNKHDKVKLDLMKFIKENLANGKESINQKVYLGAEEHLETWLVVKKVPDHVSKQRQDRYKSENGKAPSEYYTEWCGYAIFITNIPPAVFSSKIIIALYKIRWQIELIFKNFKSNLELDYLSGSNKYRIESLVYGRLITIASLSILHQYASSIAQHDTKGSGEISGDKLTKWLMVNARLRVAILQKVLLELLALLEFEIMKVCKQKRKRGTTLEHIADLFDKERVQKSG